MHGIGAGGALDAHGAIELSRQHPDQLRAEACDLGRTTAPAVAPLSATVRRTCPAPCRTSRTLMIAGPLTGCACFSAFITSSFTTSATATPCSVGSRICSTSICRFACAVSSMPDARTSSAHKPGEIRVHLDGERILVLVQPLVDRSDRRHARDRLREQLARLRLLEASALAG